MSSTRGSGGPRGGGRDSSQTAPRGRGRGAFSQAASQRGSSTTRGRGTFGQRSKGAVGQTARRGNAPQSKQAGNIHGSTSQQAADARRAAFATSGTWQERYSQLKQHREQERDEAIRAGLVADPDKPRILTDAVTPVGICTEMCAEFERVQRVVQDDVWAEEKDSSQEADESRMVKKFRRAAAGLEEQLPSDLRSPQTLKATCDYLFDEVIGSAPSLAQIHHFVWDRTRAIRNDFSIQQLSKADELRIAVDCYERIARFHILSLHQLASPERPYSKYDWSQEREQLDRTMLSLMQYYKDCRGRIAFPNEAEFRAYWIIFQLRSPTPDMEDTVQTWPSALVRDMRVRKALDLYAAACTVMYPEGPINPRATPLIARQDWQRYWTLLASHQTSYLMACVAEVHFNNIRRTVLNALLKTFRTSASAPDWTPSVLCQLLAFDTEEEVQTFCEAFGLGFKGSDDGQIYLDTASMQGRSLPPPNSEMPNQLKSRLVEKKRYGRALSTVISGLAVSDSTGSGFNADGGVEEEIDEGMGDVLEREESEQQTDVGREDEDEGEEDQESLFVPETKSEAPAASPPRSVFAFPPASAPQQSPFAPVAAAAPSRSPFAPAPGTTSSSSPFAPASTGSAPRSPFAPAPADSATRSPFAPASTNPAPGSPFAPIGPQPESPFTKPQQPLPASGAPKPIVYQSPFVEETPEKPTPTEEPAHDNSTALPPAPPPPVETPLPPIEQQQQQPSLHMLSPPVRRPSDTRPKRPSPLSQSFTAIDELAQPAPPASSPARELPKSSVPPPAGMKQNAEVKKPVPFTKPDRPSDELGKRESFDATVTRIAKELVEDQISGYLKQYVEYRASQIITSVQEEIAAEERSSRLNELRVSTLHRKYFARWCNAVWQRRLAKSGKDRRQRRRRRLEEGFDDRSSIGHSRPGSVLSGTSWKDHQENVDSMFQRTINSRSLARTSLEAEQAKAGSKRLASSIEGTSSQSLGHKRFKSTSHVDERGRVVKPSTNGRSDNDSSDKSSFLDASMNGSSPPNKSTMRSNYFKLKAMGVHRADTLSAPRGTKRSHPESVHSAATSPPHSRRSSSAATTSPEGSGRLRLMPPPSSTPSSRAQKTKEEDEALFARLREARESLTVGAVYMRTEVERDEEERRRGVPAYRLRESKFVPKGDYAKAIRRSEKLRESRRQSREASAEQSRRASQDVSFDQSRRSAEVINSQLHGLVGQSQQSAEFDGQPYVNGFGTSETLRGESVEAAGVASYPNGFAARKDQRQESFRPLVSEPHANGFAAPETLRDEIADSVDSGRRANGTAPRRTLQEESVEALDSRPYSSGFAALETLSNYRPAPIDSGSYANGTVAPPMLQDESAESTYSQPYYVNGVLEHEVLPYERTESPDRGSYPNGLAADALKYAETQTAVSSFGDGYQENSYQYGDGDEEEEEGYYEEYEVEGEEDDTERNGEIEVLGDDLEYEKHGDEADEEVEGETEVLGDDLEYERDGEGQFALGYSGDDEVNEDEMEDDVDEDELGEVMDEEEMEEYDDETEEEEIGRPPAPPAPPVKHWQGAGNEDAPIELDSD